MKLTPPALAKRWGCSPEKIIALIRAGELRAIDSSIRPGGRPRYMISEEDVRAFERRREVTPNGRVKTPKRRPAEIPQLV